MNTEMLGALTSASQAPRSAKHEVNTAASGTPSPVAVSAVAESAARDLSQKMAAVASQLQDFLNSSQRDVEFRVDADTHLQVLTVRDSITGQVIRQFPNEDVIRVVKNLTAQQGTLLDEAV
jgi:flagellar protein FlaG